MAFHTKYRPSTLDRVLGNESAVETLRKFASAERDNFPSALLLVGPPSAGKTTLARAFAREVLGENFDSNVEETNFGTDRSIEEIRGLVRLANLRPMSGGRRFIICDEAHAILSNAPATDALLKPLEEPIPSTTWILATMEPEKFGSSVKGRALRSRCVTIKLDAPSPENLAKYAARINKGEKLGLDREKLMFIASNATSFRDVANMMESLSQSTDVEAALANIAVEETPESLLACRAALYGLSGQYGKAVKELVQIKNGVSLIQMLGYLAWSLTVLEATSGKGAPGVWVNSQQRAVHGKIVKAYENAEERMAAIAKFNYEVTQLKISAGAFAVNEVQAVAAMFYKFVRG